MTGHRAAPKSDGTDSRRKRPLMATCLAILVPILLLAACSGLVPLLPLADSNGVPAPGETLDSPPPAYRLGAGDRIRLVVYGEEDMSGIFMVSGNGTVSLPLAGQVRAAGLTIKGFEETLVARLKKYIKNPQVSSEVTNYRPYYIHGELKKSGEYPYASGLTVGNAVARAGGYSYRAVTTHVYIKRGNQKIARKYHLDSPVPVMPGDNILVPERIF